MFFSGSYIFEKDSVNYCTESKKIKSLSLSRSLALPSTVHLALCHE